MLNRLNHNFTIWLFSGDMLLTLVALTAARGLRLVLPFGMQIDPLTGERLTFQQIDYVTFYGLVLIVWVMVFVTLPVYNSKRSLHAIGDVQVTLSAIGFAISDPGGVGVLFLSRVVARALRLLRGDRCTAVDGVARRLAAGPARAPSSLAGQQTARADCRHRPCWPTKSPSGWAAYTWTGPGIGRVYR